MSKAEEQIQNKDVAEIIGLRNRFLPQTLEKLSQIAVWNSIVSIALIIAIISIIAFRPAPQSYAVTPDGRIITLTPISEGIGKDTLVSFTSNAIVSAFSFDFAHWKQQLGSLAPMFTEAGFESFTTAIAPIKERVINERYVTHVGITKPPVIVRSAVINGTMKYRIHASIIIAFESQTKRVQPQTWDLNIIITRVPSSQSRIGVQIDSIVAKHSDNN